MTETMRENGNDNGRYGKTGKRRKLFATLLSGVCAAEDTNAYLRGTTLWPYSSR